MQTTTTTITANSQPHQRSITLSVMERWLRWFRWPIITVGLVFAALVAAWSASVADVFTLERTTLSNGEVWRLFTGHIAHWSAEHLFWDISVFALLGIVCERRNRKLFVITLLASAVAISLGFLTLCPELETYRGLSGIDCALLGLYLTMTWRSGSLSPRGKGLLLLVGLGFAAKMIWEVITGSAIFVQSDGMIPVPESHVIGAVVGALFGLIGRGAAKQPLTFPRE